MKYFATYIFYLDTKTLIFGEMNYIYVIISVSCSR